MGKRSWAIWTLRYTGLFVLLAGGLFILLNYKFNWELPIEVFLLSALLGIGLMATANIKDFGYPTTVDSLGIPVPPLREEDTTYKSNGLIVTSTKVKKGNKDNE